MPTTLPDTYAGAPRDETPERIGFAISLAFAGTFCLLEALKATRHADFEGLTPNAAPELVQALVVYAVLLYGLSLAAIRVIRKTSLDAEVLAWVPAPLAATVIWAVLLLHLGHLPALDDLAVPALFWIFPAYRTLGRKLTNFTSFDLGTVWLGASVCSVLITLIWGDILLHLENRAHVVLQNGLGTFCAVLVTGTLMWWGLQSLKRFRNLLRPLALLLVCAPALLFPGVGILQWRGDAMRNPGPNVVWITCDALRADLCRTFGGAIPTPNLDRLAARGTLFQQAISPAPWTLPAMFSIFDGAPHPMPDGPDQAYVFQPRGKTLAERYQEQDREATALVGNPLLGDAMGPMRGFDRVLVWNSLRPETQGRLAFTPLLQNVLATYLPGIVPVQPLDTTRTITRHARNYFRWQADTPFLLYVHYMDPHDPYSPPARFTKPPAGSPPRPWPFFAPARARDWGTPQLTEARQISLDESERAWARALYESEVRYLDAAVGSLLDSLDRNGLRDSTTVVLMADYGEELWDRGGYYHGHTLFAEQTHVPLIVAGPGIGSDIVAEPVSLLDVRPLLARITGTPTEEHWIGGDVLANGPGAPIFSYGTVPQPWVRADYSLIRDRFKLVTFRDGSHALFAYPGPETADLQEAHASLAREMRNAADAIRGKVPGHAHADEDGARAQAKRKPGGHLRRRALSDQSSMVKPMSTVTCQ